MHCYNNRTLYGDSTYHFRGPYFTREHTYVCNAHISGVRACYFKPSHGCVAVMIVTLKITGRADVHATKGPRRDVAQSLADVWPTIAPFGASENERRQARPRTC